MKLFEIVLKLTPLEFTSIRAGEMYRHDDIRLARAYMRAEGKLEDEVHRQNNFTPKPVRRRTITI